MGPDVTDTANETDPGTLAGIAYHGVAGSSYDCLDAVKSIIQCRLVTPRVRILTAGNDHALLLFTAAIHRRVHGFPQSARASCAGRS